MIRNHVCRGSYHLSERPVLINNWEATYFDFNEEKILSIAKQASELGIDLMVLDDGWFGKRDDDRSGLGDWTVNEQKLKGGLNPLVKKINELGMRFGLWFEPEMVSEDSNPYKDGMAAWAFVSEDRSQVLVQGVIYRAVPNALRRIVRLRGLTAGARYGISGGAQTYTGSALMAGGLLLPGASGDDVSFEMYLETVEEK